MKKFNKPRTKFIVYCSIVLIPFWAIGGFRVLVVGLIGLIGVFALSYWLDYLDSKKE